MVLRAYRYQCAICQLDMRLKNLTIGLEAAHIKWFQRDGPDIVGNGLSLCSMHHKLFDLGAFTIDVGYKILASEHVTGNSNLHEILIRYHGDKILLPIHKAEEPQKEYLKWHQENIFKKRALPL
jgi:putative restriction endonuclease